MRAYSSNKCVCVCVCVCDEIMSKVRRAAIDYNVPLITNLEVAEAFIKSLATVNELNVDSYLDNTDSITKH
jgi:methylglyoxal synthase